MLNNDKIYDAIVIGGGHAGVEAALALARTGKKTLMMTTSLGAVAFMACNPNIGGTAKGHLVREIDALGGQMAIAADETTLQLRMLNKGKGAAVQSLRAQTDKLQYHEVMKRVVENQPLLTVVEEEAVEILTAGGAFKGVVTALGSSYAAKAAVVCAGVYLNGEIIIGEYRKKQGPGGFAAANLLTESLIKAGLNTRRFKTGTPARVHADTVDYSVMQLQEGDSDIYPFSFMTDGAIRQKMPCYLTYTNSLTHKIITDNIHLSPLYNGSITSVGPRYCPSIEDKVMRFKDKDRHQIFIEPESARNKEIYVQGMSSSMPRAVQEQMYRSVKGLERAHIMRYAYAIEYDCIDSTALLPSLMTKTVSGLFTAGQINGSSGYEEAAAQGLIAGINAGEYLDGKEPLIIGRDEGYIGVLIDDLVTKGTNEPYRMMTARAEYRLSLRQENADLRLTQIGRNLGLVTDARYERYLTKKSALANALDMCNERVSPKRFAEFFAAAGENAPQNNSLTYKEMLKRGGITADMIKSEFSCFDNIDLRILQEAETEIKYEGYLKKQSAAIEELKKMESRSLPADIDYNQMLSLRLEARAKLTAIRPITLAQASRISGVSPADITALTAELIKRKNG